MHTHIVRVRATLVVALGLIAGALGAPAAGAHTSTATFTYSGTAAQQKNLIDTGLQYVDGCVVGDDPTTCPVDYFPGTMWYRFRAGIKSTVVTSQSSGFTLNSPDEFRQDTNALLSSQNTAVDGSGKEVTVKTVPFVEFDVAYDAPLANCPKDTIQTVDDLENADTSGCLNIVKHTGERDIGSGFQLLAQDGTLPYGGTRTFSDAQNTPSLDIGALADLPDGLVGVHLEFITSLVMTAVQGYLADRQLSASSDPSTPLLNGSISWPDTNPQDDPVHIPCTVPAGDNLIYRLTNNRWDGSADAKGNLRLVVEIPVIDDPSFSLGNLTLISGLPLTAEATPDVTETLGGVLAENKPPVISAVARDGTFVEGADNTFTAIATDNCSSTLSYKWKFSDGGIAFGRIAHHVFADNGTYTAQLTVTDQAGNSAVTDIDDLDPIVITNGNPNVSTPSNKSGAWGDPISYHVDAVDPSPVDQNTLSYRWTFGDGSFADGRDVTHAFAAPGNYGSSVLVTDKDGGTGSAGFSTAISKRATTLVYTGASSSNPSKSVPLSATLSDDHGQPVVGRLVSYGVGTQTAGAATNSAGLSSVALYVTLKPGTYTRTASFAGDSMYVASSANGSFLVGKK